MKSKRVDLAAFIVVPSSLSNIRLYLGAYRPAPETNSRHDPISDP